jgi:hypothetical protein
MHLSFTVFVMHLGEIQRERRRTPTSAFTDVCRNEIGTSIGMPDSTVQDLVQLKGRTTQS